MSQTPDRPGKAQKGIGDAGIGSCRPSRVAGERGGTRILGYTLDGRSLVVFFPPSLHVFGDKRSPSMPKWRSCFSAPRGNSRRLDSLDNPDGLGGLEWT